MQGAGEAESDEERRAEVLWKRPLLEKDGEHEHGNLVECGGRTFDVLALQVSDPGRARCRDGCEAMQDPGRLNAGRLGATAGPDEPLKMESAMSTGRSATFTNGPAAMLQSVAPGRGGGLT